MGKIIKPKLKSEKRIAKKKKRRYPVSGRGVFVIAKIKKTRLSRPSLRTY